MGHPAGPSTEMVPRGSACAPGSGADIVAVRTSPVRNASAAVIFGIISISFVLIFPVS
jgi:hypothetical protein